MYAQGILELRDIVISFLACLVWNMQAYAAIDTKDNEIQVIPYAQPSPQSQIPEKPSPFHLPAMPLGVIVDQPDGPGIQEGRPIQTADSREAVFQVRLELQIPRLVNIAIAVVRVGTETPRSHAPDSECTQAVRSTDIKLLAIRSRVVFRIPITIYHPGAQASHQMVPLCQHPVVTDFRTNLCELREDIS